MGTHYKWLAIIEKALGKYSNSLEYLKKAKENLDVALSYRPPKECKEKIIETQNYLLALEHEIRAQIALFSYQFSQSLKEYDKASKLYEKTGDERSSRWCKTIFNILKGLELMFDRNFSDAYKHLRRAYIEIPDELKMT